MAAYPKEVKEAVAHGVMSLRIHILTNETSDITQLKGMWQQIIKNSTYQHLDLHAQHMKYHV